MSKAGKIAATVAVTLLAMLVSCILSLPGLAVGKETVGAFVFPYALLTKYITKTPGWHLLFFALAPFLIYGFLFCRAWLRNREHYFLLKLLILHILLGIGCAWLFSLDQN